MLSFIKFNDRWIDGNFALFLDKCWIPILIVWGGWILLPLLDTGFISDDAYNSQTLGRLISDNVGLLQRVSDESLGWLKGAGRFNPVNWGYIYGMYTLTTSFLIVKTIGMLLTLVSILLFAQLTYEFSGSVRLRLLCVLTIPLLIQFRLWHDPVVGFSAIIPLVCGLCFLSAIVFKKSIKQDNAALLIPAVLIFLIAILTYELAYFFFPIFILLFLANYNCTKRLSRVGAYGITIIFILLTTHYGITKVLMTGKNSYPALIPRADSEYFLKATLYQLSSALPLTWKLASGVPHQRSFPLVGLQTYIFLLFSMYYAYLLYYWKDRVANRAYLFALSLALIIFPAIPAVISGHQAEIANAGLGYGYIVVFAQYFGVGLLLLVLLQYLHHKISGRIAANLLFVIFISLAISLSGLLTRNENEFVVKQLEWPYKIPRAFLEKVVKSGFLDEVGPADTIIRNYSFPNDNGWFYAQSAGRKINLCSSNIDYDYIPCIDKRLKQNDRGRFFGFYYSIPKGDGSPFAVLAELDDKISLGDFKENNLPFVKYKIYREEGVEHRQSKVPYNFYKFLLAPVQAEADFDQNSLLDTKFNKIPVDYENFWPVESDGKSILRWSSGESRISVYNKKSVNVLVDMTFTIIRPDDKVIGLDVILSSGTTKNYSVSHSREFKYRLELAPGLTTLNLFSGAPHILNGDPRNIVFGIVNFNLKEIDR